MPDMGDPPYDWEGVSDRLSDSYREQFMGAYRNQVRMGIPKLFHCQKDNNPFTYIGWIEYSSRKEASVALCKQDLTQVTIKYNFKPIDQWDLSRNPDPDKKYVMDFSHDLLKNIQGKPKIVKSGPFDFGEINKMLEEGELKMYKFQQDSLIKILQASDFDNGKLLSLVMDHFRG